MLCQVCNLKIHLPSHHLEACLLVVVHHWFFHHWFFHHWCIHHRTTFFITHTFYTSGASSLKLQYLGPSVFIPYLFYLSKSPSFVLFHYLLSSFVNLIASSICLNVTFLSVCAYYRKVYSCTFCHSAFHNFLLNITIFII